MSSLLTSQGLVTVFFYPSTTLKTHKGVISNVKFSYNIFFKIVLYWCLDLMRHNIGIHLKLNKYIFDISIPFCYHLYLSATLKQCFTEFAVSRTTFHHVDMSVRSYVRFEWSVIFRVRIAKNVLIFKPDHKNNQLVKF